MEIIVTTNSDKFSEQHDYRNLLKIAIKNGMFLYFLDGEPEDANLTRDFNDCYSILDMMEAAYEAGKKGESLTITKIETDDFI